MGPVFVGGLDRSGKTYMRLMLASHPSFAVSRRTDLWTRFYRRFGGLQRDANLDRCLAALGAHKHIQSLGIDLGQLRLEFAGGPRTYARLFRLIHQAYAQRMGKPRWGDQSELLERRAKLVLEAYPEARFIHMLRDPRDRYAAILSKSNRRGGVGAACARWLYSAGLAEQNRQLYPERYRVVRYERMVSRPEDVMRAVCEFLGEQFEPAMCSMGAATRFIGQGEGERDEMSTPLTIKYVGEFREKLDIRDIAFTQHACGRLMREFDYSLAPIRFSWAENVRFYGFHLFANAARMIGWRMRNMASA